MELLSKTCSGRAGESVVDWSMSLIMSMKPVWSSRSSIPVMSFLFESFSPPCAIHQTQKSAKFENLKDDLVACEAMLQFLMYFLT